MKHYVHIIPNCPICKSNITGRYIDGNILYADKLRSDYLKKGEYVQISNQSANLFCVECGFEWTGNFTTKWMSSDEFKKHCNDIGITKDEFDMYDKQLVAATVQARTKQKKLPSFIKKGTKALFHTCVSSIISPITELKEVEKGFYKKEETSENEKLKKQ